MYRSSAHRLLLLVAIGMIKMGFFIGSYVCLTSMVILMALDPVMRYLAGSPFFWSNEVTTYLMILMVFNGFSVTLIKGGHIRATLIFCRLSRKVQNVLWLMICLAGLVYVGFLAYSIILLTVDSFTFGVKTITSELIIFPWQMLVAWGLIVFFVGMTIFTVRRIAIALGRAEEEIPIDKAIGY